MQRKPIVLVEDNDDDIILTLRAFKKKGIANNILVAKDGVQALDILFGTEDQPPVQPALVLLDLKLPKLDGLDILKRMQNNERTKGLPVVILTTSTEEDDVVKSYKLGANSYIRKPVDFDRFLDAIGQLGLYWLVLNQPLPEDGS
ncbi:response regulator [Fulvivirga sp. M361]|uniref:response regulator n=1 Tax=Fulvivirga sp. M361 TaxID=2594266 RepID=UPI001179D1D8|nr:response regulator [Fulvivirga sp. M361]TRX47188.1 response regulator [Fulvivirga sp. M361]